MEWARDFFFVSILSVRSRLITAVSFPFHSSLVSLSPEGSLWAFLCHERHQRGAEGCIALRNFGPFSRALISLVSQGHFMMFRAIHLLMWKMRQRANRPEGGMSGICRSEKDGQKISPFSMMGTLQLRFHSYHHDFTWAFFIDVSEKIITFGWVENRYLHVTLEIEWF